MAGACFFDKPGLDESIQNFVDLPDSLPGRVFVAGGENHKFILEWQKDVPLYLDEEGYIDETTTATKSGRATVQKIVELNDKEFRVIAKNDDGKTVEYTFKGKILSIA